MTVKCVITVDIKSSTTLNGYQRELIQKRIFDVIERLKEKLAEDLFTIGMTAGDEFQVVINSPEKAIDIFRFLRDNLGTKFYFGMGIGSVEAVAEDLQPSEMYGSAFYSSRKALDRAKKKQVEIVFSTGDEKLDFQLNTLIELIQFVRRKWTKRQREILNFMESHEEIKQKDIAEHFGVSKQAISKTIKASGFELVRRAERLIETLLRP